MPIRSLIMDTREHPEIASLDFGMPMVRGTNISTALPHGDIWITGDDGQLITIERKTGMDFMASIKDDRLFNQVARMRASTPWAYVAVVGTVAADLVGLCVIDGRPTAFRYAAYMGARMTVQEMGAVIIDVQDDHGLVQVVKQLADRKRGPVRLKPHRDPLAMSGEEVILGSFPGIGPTKTAKLLAHCGTAAVAIQYLTDPSTESEDKAARAGDALRVRARAALGLRNNEVMAVLLADEDQAAAINAMNERYHSGQAAANEVEPEPIP